ncbi:MAG: hypothetical protein HY033_12800 [Ignavibacteriae bacterium]|nr:hypothetical protein [Ignavibacteria bacterium]MBI3365772.1 hypothetical protein [Ignavibacteriota bacterium]
MRILLPLTYKIVRRTLPVLLLWYFPVPMFSQSGWFWQNPLPQGNDLYGVQAFATGTIVAVGSAGTVMTSTNYGLSWDVQRYVGGAFGTFRSISFFSPASGIIVGDSGSIFTSSDGGARWIRRSSPVNHIDLNYVTSIDANHDVAVGDSGTILRTTNGGLSWLNAISGTRSNLWSAYFPVTGVGYTVGETNTILKSIDFGTNWVRLDSTAPRNYFSVFFTTQDSGWVVGSQGIIRRTTDGGMTWISQASHSAFALYALTFTNKSNAFAVGDARIISSHNGGEFWDAESLDATNGARGIFFTDTSSGWIAGLHGEIKRTVDGGATWSSLTRGSRVNLNAISIPAQDQTYAIAVGDKGIVMRTTNAGAEWTTSSTPTTKALRSVYFISSNAGIVVGDNGVILQTIDGGQAWNSIQSDSSNLTSVYFADGLNGWAAGFDGAVFQTTNAGSVWSRRSISGIDSSTIVTSVFFVDPEYGWMSANFGPTRSYTRFLKTTDGGVTWNVADADSMFPVLAIYFANRNVGWAVGKSANPLKTTDGGQSWFTQYPPYHPKTSYQSVRFIDENTGWAVGTNGNVIKTTNGGKNWYSQLSGTNNLLSDIAMFDSATGWIVGANGAILKTTDGGGPLPAPPPPPPSKPPIGLSPTTPNPFIPSKNEYVYLPFSVVTPGDISLRIYDILGRLILAHDLGYFGAGTYDESENPGLTPTWDGKNQDGVPVVSGIYFYKYITRDFISTGKLILIR